MFSFAYTVKILKQIKLHRWTQDHGVGTCDITLFEDQKQKKLTKVSVSTFNLVLMISYRKIKWLRMNMMLGSNSSLRKMIEEKSVPK